MQKRGNKSGQFYFVAAVILIAILIGFSSIVNYSKKRTTTKISDIREELKIESEKILDYETYTRDSKIENFTKDYSDYVGEDIEIYFITGTNPGIEAYKYEGDQRININPTITGNKINVPLYGLNYEFNLKPGKNFYFILSQDINGENHVLTG
ncbi:MAG: hypothetical protein KKF48_03545 [Nanoarchaeota archaeon]|nr:hypothetical protein [Nanoarchaeota archaeon]MBU1028094.1 hypothetical protein [Nanoarchaeota archaeon]